MSLRGRLLHGLGFGGRAQRLQLYLGNNDETPQAPDFALRRYYGIDIGQGLPKDVVESTTSTGKDIEIVFIYNTEGADRRKAVDALNALKYYLLFDTWPPA